MIVCTVRCSDLIYYVDLGAASIPIDLGDSKCHLPWLVCIVKCSDLIYYVELGAATYSY